MLTGALQLLTSVGEQTALTYKLKQAEADNPVVKLNGFVKASTQPVVAAFGAGAVHGKAITCQAVSVPVLVQPNVTDDEVIFVAVNKTGLGHVGAGEQDKLANQPAAVPVAFDVNTNVKQPFAADDVKDGGNVVPVKVAISGAVASLPL